ncbi:hypothetical protein S2E19_05551 [Bacillus mycoides]|nr:hypothetical protein S2E19_05551 [Bacillus mycoides]OSY07299.1 hypothetical protein BTJ44_01763 [Bacillus mycoides]
MLMRGFFMFCKDTVMTKRRPLTHDFIYYFQIYVKMKV